MVKQYPHTLILTVVASSSQDSEGNWVNGASSTLEVPCRYETSGGSRFIRSENGDQIIYQGIVYAEVSTADIALGTTLQIKNGDTIIAKGKVEQFSRGQFNVRIWLS